MFQVYKASTDKAFVLGANIKPCFHAMNKLFFPKGVQRVKDEIPVHLYGILSSLSRGYCLALQQSNDE